MGNIKGINHHTGPQKCLIYLTPWNFIPMAWVTTNVHRAKARVVLRLAVGEKEARYKTDQVGNENKRKMVAI